MAMTKSISVEHVDKTHKSKKSLDFNDYYDELEERDDISDMTQSEMSKHKSFKQKTGTAKSNTLEEIHEKGEEDSQSLSYTQGSMGESSVNFKLTQSS